MLTLDPIKRISLKEIISHNALHIFMETYDKLLHISKNTKLKDVLKMNRKQILVRTMGVRANLYN